MAIPVLVILVLSVGYIVQSQGCGKTKSCFKWPDNCKTLSDCKIFVTYSFNSSDNTLDVEISGYVSGWIAFGLNGRPRYMGGTHGEICYFYEGKVVLRGFENIGFGFYFRNLDSGTIIDKKEYSNGTLSCRYRRSVTGSYMKSLDSKWYLISSWGDMHHNRRGRVKPREHLVGSYFWSKDIIDLKRSNDVQCTTFDWNMITLHGIVMVLAWVGFAASAVFYARYAKVVWSNVSIAGESIWFQLHRGFMIVAVILTVTGVIIILVEAKGINDEFLLHAVLGISLVICSVIQTFLGIFRPKPSSCWRKTFNWVHWAFGTMELILAAISIITGHSFLKISPAAMITYITIIFLSFAFLEVRRCIKFRRIITESCSLELQNIEEKIENQPSSNSAKEQIVRKIVACIVLGSGFLFAIIMIGLIASEGHSLINAVKMNR